jgi:hypothetical protein
MGSRIALAALACPGRRGLIHIFKQQKISRGAMAPELWNSPALLRTEGAGKTGCALHPRSRVQNAHSKSAHEHTGSAETLRPSLRSGFTTYFVLSPVTGLSCHRRLRNRFRKLDTSVGVSGPHDFAVRFSVARLATHPRPPHPAPTLVTMANAPLSGTGWDVI